MDNNIEILKEHYDEVIATILSEIRELDIQVFNRAVTWSKTRYRKKFTASSAQTLKSMLTEMPKKSLTPLAESFNDPESFPPLKPSTQSVMGSYAGTVRENRGFGREGKARLSLTPTQAGPKGKRGERNLKQHAEQTVEVPMVTDLTKELQIIMEEKPVSLPSTSTLLREDLESRKQTKQLEPYSNVVC